MIKLGKMQTLEVIKETTLGVYLNTKNKKDNDVLLPSKQMPLGISIGDKIEVFVYHGPSDQIIATTTKPKLTLDELAVLKVVDTTNFGAFLDWGLEKDLLLPFKEQISHVEKGREYLVGLFINNFNRLSATMKIYDLLSSTSPYKANQRVRGCVYNINKELGIFVAVDNKYHGMILNKELYGNYNIGDNIEARVKNVRKDGKLELSLREQTYNQIEIDAKTIFERMKLEGGALPLNSNTSPEKIKSDLNMSKSAFKRAVGRLLKEGAIEITEEGIKMMW